MLELADFVPRTKRPGHLTEPHVQVSAVSGDDGRRRGAHLRARRLGDRRADLGAFPDGRGVRRGEDDDSSRAILLRRPSRSRAAWHSHTNRSLDRAIPYRTSNSFGHRRQTASARQRTAPLSDQPAVHSLIRLKDCKPPRAPRRSNRSNFAFTFPFRADSISDGADTLPHAS
jgi:hypothetical protein